jgi:hypothetical protein
MIAEQLFRLKKSGKTDFFNWDKDIYVVQYGI